MTMSKGKPVIFIRRLGMVMLAVVLATIGVLGSYSGNTPAALAASDVGYRDFSFAANAVDNPTGEKPQSKLWFNDGIWWASLFDRSTEEYHIYRYDWTAHTWSDTGTLIDERNTSKADTLWDGTHLYVVSAGEDSTNQAHGARVLRYSYDSATKRYTLDQGFPVTITSGGPEAIVLDKDTTGKLWVTYTRNKQVYVNRTTGDDRTWGTPFVLPVNGANVGFDDISSVVAFDSQIGVMWSNQIDDAMYFATHTDGDPDDAWQGSRAAIQGPKNADDHISLRSLQAADSSGRVFAAVKTSLGDLNNPNPNAPQILLLVRDRDGNWTNHVFGRVGDNHTRPIVMLDEEHRDLYMFATAPCCAGGAIYYKKTSLNNISFSDGLGEPFIQSDTDLNINDATSTKQNLSSATGLMVMASSGTVISGTTGSGYYWHNAADLGGVDDIPPETTIDSGPSGTVNATSASFVFSSTEPDSTFECALDGASFSGCTSPRNYTGLSAGSHTFQVRATDTASNTDTTPAERSWMVDTTAPVVDSVAPADGAMNVAVAGNIEASFSEAMDASTLTTSTFTITKQGSTSPLAATVSYDGANKKATLDPASNLEANTSYTARVTGGSSGAKNLAGNALAQDYSWTFITASPPVPSCTITGTANAETISGTSADDVICAGGGNDTINGLGGNDTLKGEAGNDTLLGGVGNDTLDGGLGTDTASYSASLTAVIASLATNSATGEGSDTFLGVENLLGSSKADTLTGSTANNRLTGGGGSDTAHGGLGNDTVQGNGGADTLKGEDGDDTVNSKDGVNGNDSLDGGAGTDTKVTDATEQSIVNFP